MASNYLLVRFERGLTDVDRPTIEDLEAGTSRFFIDDEHRDAIIRLLTRRRLCLIRGAEGRGKTVLSRIVGKSLVEENWSVWISDLARLEDTSHLVENVKTIGWKKKRTLIIIENSHRADADLLRELMDLQLDADFEGSLLFTTRSATHVKGDPYIDGPFKHVIEHQWVRELHPDPHTVEEIIKKRISSYELDLKDKAWIGKELGEIPNLRRLRWYLDAWMKKPRRRLADVDRNEVYAEVRLDTIGKVDESCGEALIWAAAILQLDIGFDPLVLDPRTSNSLEREGLVWLINGFYRMPEHSYDARLITEAEADKYRQSPDALTIQKVRGYLDRGPRNCAELLQSLLRQENPAIRDAVTFSNLSNLIEKMASHATRDLVATLGYLAETNRESAARDLWQKWRICGEDSERHIQEELGEISAGTALQLFHLLDAIDPDLCGRLKQSLTADAILKKANRHNIKAVGTLLHDRSLEGLPNRAAAAQQLAEQLAGMGLIHTHFFLQSLKPPRGDAFSMELVRALHKEPEFIQAIGNSKSFGPVRNYLKQVGKIDIELRREANRLIPEEQRYTALRRSSFATVVSEIAAWAKNRSLTDTVNPRTKQDRVAQRLLKDLGSGEFRAKVTRTAAPIRQWSLLLHALRRVPLDPKLRTNILIEIPNLVNCADSKCPLDQLGKLLANLRHLDEDVWRALATKVRDQCDFARTVQDLNPSGPFLIWHVFQIDKGAASRIAQMYFEQKPCTIGERWRSGEDEDDPLSTLLWNLAQIDLKSSQKWVRENTHHEWRASIAGASTPRLFTILLALYLIDAKLTKELLRGLAAELLTAGTALKADDLAFAGLDAYVGGRSRPGLIYPPADEIGYWLAERHHLRSRIFAIHAARRISPGLASRSLAIASRRLFVNGETVNFSEALGKVTDGAIRALLSDALGDAAMPEEPQSTLSVLLSALKAALAGRRWISFYRAMGVVGDSLQIDRGDAQEWLTLAIRSGTLIKEERPQESRDETVTFIALSTEG